MNKSPGMPVSSTGMSEEMKPIARHGVTRFVIKQKSADGIVAKCPS
ncbi:MAG: hypothetical protein GY752_05465 [bacterium]|nr:hypothetical protein [bacterium]